MNPTDALIALYIEDIRLLSPGFKQIIFSDEHRISWQPGQFLIIVDQPGPNALRRSYSIISDPGSGEKLAIAVKRIDNGFFSRFLTDRAVKGDRLLTIGAAGRFLLPDNTTVRRLYFFAAGSGIAPIISLLKAALRKETAEKIFLIYSNHSHRYVPFRDELENLSHKHSSRFTIQYHFSDAMDIRQARLTRDTVLSLLDQEPAAYANDFFYCCGPVSYMRRIIFVLREYGIPSSHIRKEEFVVNRAALPSHRPPDLRPHAVTIQAKSKIYHFIAGYPHPILRAAIRAGFDLPYSCETGRCGSCAARCIQGTVWMSENEVLTPTDISNGIVLTCTGYPVDGDVILRLD